MTHGEALSAIQPWRDMLNGLDMAFRKAVDAERLLTSLDQRKQELARQIEALLARRSDLEQSFDARKDEVDRLLRAQRDEGDRINRERTEQLEADRKRLDAQRAELAQDVTALSVRKSRAEAEFVAEQAKREATLRDLAVAADKLKQQLRKLVE